MKMHPSAQQTGTWAIKLDVLNTHTIQGFYNSMLEGGKQGLSPKTIKNVHGVLHRALKQAVLNGCIRFNPINACSLPRKEGTELKPLDELDIANFLKAIKGHRFEDIFVVTLFTGLRKGEVLGLTWGFVDFSRGSILINKQMQLHQEKGMANYTLVSKKNERGRTITAAPTVMNCLKRRRSTQAQHRLAAGSAWGRSDLVFTISWATI